MLIFKLGKNVYKNADSLRLESTLRNGIGSNL